MHSVQLAGLVHGCLYRENTNIGDGASIRRAMYHCGRPASPLAPTCKGSGRQNAMAKCDVLLRMSRYLVECI